MFLDDAQEALRPLKERGAQATLTYEEAVNMQDWLMSEFLSGNIPPVRPSVLASLQAPGNTYACSHPDCRHTGNCRGNRLEVDSSGQVYSDSQTRISLQPTPPSLGGWEPIFAVSTPAATPRQQRKSWRVAGQGVVACTPGGGLHTFFDSDSEDESEEFHHSEDAAAGEREDGGEDDRMLVPRQCSDYRELPQVKLVVVHHKNAARFNAHRLEVILPYDLALAVTLYMDYAWPLLAVAEETNRLFIRPGRPDPMSPEQLCLRWHEVQQKHAAPWSSFKLQASRHIHVAGAVQDLADAAAEAGTSLDGDAAIMTNTAGIVWQRHYCKDATYFAMMAESAVDKMTAWRRSRLAELVQDQDGDIQDMHGGEDGDGPEDWCLFD